MASLFCTRYILHDLLGEGGMGAVYRAQDRLTGQFVALKRVLAPADQLLFNSRSETVEARLALAQEFQTLASLRHPNIISVLDYGFDEQKHPYFTMDLLVEAQNVLKFGQRQSLAGRLNILIQILQALTYLHRRGIIHRDLKPGNVMMVGNEVKVLDFGLSIGVGQQGGIAGTLAYMAPEILMDGVVSAAADLYSVGVIAYELLSGKRLYTTSDYARLVDEILDREPDYEAVPMPGPVIDILRKLLAKNPAQRYADSAEVIADLCAATGLPTPPENQAIRESFLQAARLVGRDPELERLSTALDAALSGEGSTWLIGGESGVGKSRLLRELATRALIRGALVLSGQAISEGGTPYQMWREVLRRLALATDLSDSEASILAELIPDIGTLLGRAVQRAPDIESNSAQARLLNTLSAVFRREQQPIVIVLEDLHWAGADSRAILAQLNQLTAKRPLLIVGTYRDDERPELPGMLPAMKVQKLNRLSETGIAQLSASMLGEAGRQPEVIDLLQRETEGNVFFLVEVVRALAEEAGQLADVGRRSLPEKVFAGGVQRIVQRRLDRVPVGARPLMQTAAVLGRELDLAVLKAASALNNLEYVFDIQRWLLDCANAAVLEIHDQRWRFAHDKLREAILSSLEPQASTTLHTQVATAIETVYPDDLDQAPALTYHWRIAGNADKEKRYARLAGVQARKVSDYREAIGYFERALELTDSADYAGRGYLNDQLGGTLFWMGEFIASRARCEAGLVDARLAGDRRVIAGSLDGLGDVALQQGQYVEAEAYYGESLGIGYELNDADVITHALSGLGDVAWRLGMYPQSRKYMEENLSLARAYGKPSVLINALNMLGIVCSMQAEYEPATQYFSDAVQMAQEVGDRARVAQALSNLGELARVQQKYDEARQFLSDALVIDDEVENRYGQANILSNLGTLSFLMGAFDDARRYFYRTLVMSRAIGSVPLILSAFVGFGRLAARSGQAERAVELVGLALNHPNSSSDLKQNEARPFLSLLEAVLMPSVVNAALERGAALDLEATAEALLAENAALEQDGQTVAKSELEGRSALDSGSYSK